MLEIFFFKGNSINSEEHFARRLRKEMGDYIYDK